MNHDIIFVYIHIGVFLLFFSIFIAFVKIRISCNRFGFKSRIICNTFREGSHFFVANGSEFESSTHRQFFKLLVYHIYLIHAETIEIDWRPKLTTIQNDSFSLAHSPEVDCRQMDCKFRCTYNILVFRWKQSNEIGCLLKSAEEKIGHNSFRVTVNKMVVYRKRVKCSHFKYRFWKSNGIREHKCMTGAWVTSLVSD